MQPQTLPVGSVTVAPPSRRRDPVRSTVRSIRRAERLVRDTRGAGPRPPGTPPGTPPGAGGSSAPAGSTRKCSGGSSEGAGSGSGSGSDCVGVNKTPRPRTTGGTFPVGAPRGRVSLPPPSLRELCAGSSAAAALGYARRVREVEAALRRQASRVAQEGARLQREQAHLQGALRGVTARIHVNRKSCQTRRPAAALKERDGADDLLQSERSELKELEQKLEQARRCAGEHLQALAESSRRLLDCARERARVLELLPRGSSSAAPRTFTDPNPVGPFTPECKQVLASSSSSLLGSQQLRRLLRSQLSGAILCQEAAHRRANLGLERQVAQSVGLQQRLALARASVRQAAARKHRQVDWIQHSHGRAQGPESSADVLSREKLDRPLVQVYQRHPGSRLPEAARLSQGSAVLRTCLTSNEAELLQLQRACAQLQRDLRGKSAEAQRDAGVVRMRRQQVDRRVLPAFLQQGVC